MDTETDLDDESCGFGCFLFVVGLLIISGIGVALVISIRSIITLVTQ